MVSAPWEMIPEGSRSTHDPAYELRNFGQDYLLVNDAAGVRLVISGDGGLYRALDVAEALILGGTEGTHDRNMLRGD